MVAVLVGALLSKCSLAAVLVAALLSSCSTDAGLAVALQHWGSTLDLLSAALERIPVHSTVKAQGLPLLFGRPCLVVGVQIRQEVCSYRVVRKSSYR